MLGTTDFYRPRRTHPLLGAALMLASLGLLLTPCVWFAIALDAVWGEEVKERRGPPEDVDESVRWTIVHMDVAKFVDPLKPQAESVSDGFHGEGYDWYTFELSPQQMAMYADALRNEVTYGRFAADHRPPPTDGHPPGWWDVESVKDLEAMVPRHATTWWIGISPSRCRVYFRSQRL